MDEDTKKIIRRVKTAGAVFFGSHSPVAMGDYYAGPSHVLPTSGTGRFFSGLSVYDFLKRTSVIGYEAQALRHAARDVQTLAKAEGLDMHSRSIDVRLQE